MTRRAWKPGGSALLAAAAWLACGPPDTQQAPTGALAAPVNLCPDHPCSAYQQSATPGCNGGVCIVSATLPNLVLVVSLSEDSYFAPGRSFALPFDQVLNQVPTHTSGCEQTNTCCDATPNCRQLPGYAVVQGLYDASPQTQQLLSWNLGNPESNTALPVHVTYRPLWPPDGTPDTGADAFGLGLPLMPVAADVVFNGANLPGPAGGPSMGFLAYLQPGAYEATIMPDPPFDAAFPPDVKRIQLPAGTSNDLDELTPDKTTRIPEANGPVIPTFDLSRVAGLDGWTAYLRDAVTKRRVSSLAVLSGPKKRGVQLATNHHPPLPLHDALDGVELVLAPPAGQPVPTGVYAPIGNELSQEESYNPLLTPATVSGSVRAADGSPVEADLVFEALSIYEAGSTMPNPTNYEYVGRASARVDTATGESMYSLVLPRGEYQLTVKPIEAPSGDGTPQPGVTIVPSFLVDASGDPLTGKDVTVGLQQTVTGSTATSDERPLSGAEVEAIPLQCFNSKASQQWCLPRAARTTTQDDGSYALALDPGSYALRIQPPDGTRFPWVLFPSLLVGPTPVTLPAITVPAPVYAGLVLHDTKDNPIVHAVVQVFRLLPAAGQGTTMDQGTALEIGRAITDANGHYDMYLAPATQ